MFTKTLAKPLVLTLLIFILFLSCQKTGIVTGISPLLPDLTTKVNSTVSGFVTDENDSVVNNATVLVGEVSVTTDNYGYFKVVNANVVQNASVIVITKIGYFKSIKTYIAVVGKSTFCRIKMMRKSIVGSVNSVSGGSVSLSNGLKIALPANCTVNALTNVAYSGTVNIAANWIDPTGVDLDRIMPGNLSGLNANNNLQLLASYGMAAVELTGANGELLQILTGKKAALTFPIPTKLSATAPATIPLWYFNEVNGLWKQEGTATKSGSNYVGEVSHFSFWNCDVPFNFVQFNCTVVDLTGHAVPNAKMKISVVNSPAALSYSYTNSEGFTTNLIPNDSQLLLEIFGNSSCGTAVYSQTFATTNQNISWGNIVISTATSLANITGAVTNCSNTSISNGYVILQIGSLYDRYPIGADGTYNFNQLICGGVANNITLVAIDTSKAEQSLAKVYPITSGNNIIPAIKACQLHEQFLNYTINGVAYSYYTPVDHFFPQATGGQTTMYWYYINNDTELDFTRAGIAEGSKQTLFKFTCPFNQIPYSPGFNTASPITVNITEFGPIDNYISGNFAGVIIGADSSNTPYHITCDFRVRRAY